MSANGGAIAPLKFAIVATVEKESINADRDVARTSLDQIPLRNAHFSLGRTLRAAIIALAMIIASTAASSAQESCPPSPDYTPDFSSNGTCLALNSNAILFTNNSTVLQLTTSTGSQVGSAWYLTPQTVTNGFSTTFQFQFTNPSTPPADGIAFLIQNSGTSAIGYTGGNGGALGYGDDDADADPTSGIYDSVAIEFDTYQNGWDPAPVNGVDSHVAIQSCGAGPNTSHHNENCYGTTQNSTLGQPVSTESSGINFADGNVHTVTIDYTPACSTCSTPTVANIQVYVDDVNIFLSTYPNGVPVNLSTIASETGTAYVGFTGATGGDWETQDILNWTFAPIQGTPISSTNPSSLDQTFVISGVTGQYWSFDFNESTANSNGTLTIQGGTIPYINNSGISESNWASIVNGTAMADTSCLLSAVDPNVCAVNTMTCTTATNSTPQGSNCPQSTARNILFDQEIDVVQTQTGISSGFLTIPSGYAPGFALLPDVFPPDPCVYPTGGPLGGQLCPESILTRIADNTPKPGGTTTNNNSSYVFFCCEPEWSTTPTIPFWNNTLSVPASFTSVPPPTPNPNPNNFQAAEGAFVVVGAEPHGTVLDTTYPLPGEQSLYNSFPCPTLAAPPANPWSTQNPQTFSVSGMITNYDNGTSTPASLTDGAYDAHYFSVDCDSFEELVFPASLNVMPGTPGGNNASFKTVQFNIDTTPPQVTSITLNPPGGYYQPNAVVTATVTCTDPASYNFYSGIATCGALGSPQVFALAGQPTVGPQTVTTTPITLNTSTVGSQTFTATATDVAGNVSLPMSANYQVVGSATLYELLLGNLTVETGKNITYTIIVINSGPSTADEVTVTNPIPAGTTFVSSGYAIDTCSFTPGVPPSCSITAPTKSCGSVAGTCNIGALSAWTSKTNPVGAVVQITVNVTAKANSTITDSETLTEANSNPNSKNDSQTWTTCVTK